MRPWVFSGTNTAERVSPVSPTVCEPPSACACASKSDSINIGWPLSMMCCTRPLMGNGSGLKRTPFSMP